MSATGMGIPRSSELHWSRERLIGPVLSGAPLTIVRAPDGSGKSALLVEVADALKRAGDSRCVVVSGQTLGLLDVANLWAHVAQELRRPANVGDGPSDLLAAKEAVFEALSNSDEKTYLIVDDSSFLTHDDSELILLLLKTFRHFFVIVSSQTRGELEAASGRLVFDAYVVGAIDLTFTSDEVTEYMRHHLPQVPASTVTTVHEYGRGHAAMTKAAVRGLLRVKGVGYSAERGVLESLMSAVVAAPLDAALRDGQFAQYLYLASVVDTLTTGLSEALGVVDGAAFLERAEEVGLGAWGVARPDHFAFLPPILDRLRRDRLRNVSAPDVMTAVRDAVDYLVDNDRFACALHTALRNHHYDLGAALVRADPGAVLCMGAEDLRDALSGVPEHVVDARPELASLAAVLQFQCAPAKPDVRAILDRSAGAARSQRDTADPMRGALLYSTESAALCMIGRADLALDASRTSAQLLEVELGRNPAALPRTEFAVVTNAATMIAAGAYREAMGQLVRAAGSPTSVAAGVFANAHLAAAAALSGDMVTARGAAQWVEEVTIEADEDSLMASSVSTMMALYKANEALERGELVEAALVLAALGGPPGANPYWSAIAAQRGVVDLMLGTSHQGLSRLRSARSRRHADSASALGAAHLDYVEQLLASSVGQGPDLVQVRAGISMRTAPGVQLLGYGRGLYQTGRFGRALQVLGRAEEANDSTFRVQAEALGLQAAILTRFDAERDLEGVLGRLQAHLEEFDCRAQLALLSAEDTAAIVEAGARFGFDRLGLLLSDVKTRPPALEAIIPLTKRERQVLTHLDSKETMRDISARLFVSENTVRTHVKSIYKKLGVSKRQDAVAVGGARGLLGSD